MKILVVDDVVTNRELLYQILKPFGLSDKAEDGEKAFERFVQAHRDNAPYDVIFLDIMMPGIDGVEVLEKIRAWESENLTYGQEVKIVMATAMQDKTNILNSFKAGCEDYLVKPFSKAKILESFQKLGLKASVV